MTRLTTTELEAATITAYSSPSYTKKSTVKFSDLTAEVQAAILRAERGEVTVGDTYYTIATEADMVESNRLMSEIFEIIPAAK